MGGCAGGNGAAGLVMEALAALPLPLAHRLGAGLGRTLSLLPNRSREVTRRNLALCFPELSAAERKRLAVRTLIETGKTALETPRIWCSEPDAVLRLVRGASGEAAVEGAMAEGRGVIVAGPHLGAWEVIGLYLGSRYPMTSLYRPPHWAALDRLIHDSRERTGASLVPTDAQGVRALFKRVARGEMIGILPDQDPGYRAGVFAPFFGIPAVTMTLLAKVAQKSGALVVVGFAERLPRAEGYHIHLEPVDEAIYDPDPVTSTTALNRAVEQAVRRRPEQYQWSYKRFRRRPPGEPPLY